MTVRVQEVFEISGMDNKRILGMSEEDIVSAI